MLVSLDHARAGARRLTIATILPLVLTGCSGGDLLLPDDDRTPVQLRAVSGDGQSAVAGSPVPHPLVAQAVDRAGRPVEGAIVRFEFLDPPAGAAIAPAAPATDPSGRASVEVTLGTPPGDQPAEARLEGPDGDLRVRFLLTAIRPNSGGGGGGGGGDDDNDNGSRGGGGGEVDGGGGGGGGAGSGGGGAGDEDNGGKGKGKGKCHGKGNGHGRGHGDD